MLMQQPNVQPMLPASMQMLQAMGGSPSQPSTDVPIYDRWLEYWLGQRNTDMYRNDASYRKLVEEKVAQYSRLSSLQQ